ncbi:zinc finger protein [Cryptococcus wingfieldii CBS 7118]|uniref:Zinc finger protein n=1 Tax=Cryptococcus wingfieldii CBS 7118 TaxID=1295528 RepID=A0A1E3IY79_9TREE|nr:zinc finger protein [Cryptococcus wingfieldii CBS 7118]ODN93508.1 zinc finger protein [Cryptococcus wingfieldii CBS 7118]
MCKHILNAQVAIRAPCCKKWFDCPECHAESQDHELTRTMEMVFLCKKCKKAFRKDMSEYEEADEFCPHCDNQYVIEAKEAKPMLGVEGEDARMDNRMLKDDREKEKPERSVFNSRDVSDKLDTMPLYQLNPKQQKGR